LNYNVQNTTKNLLLLKKKISDRLENRLRDWDPGSQSAISTYFFTWTEIWIWTLN
jgi:hypothetical protein